MEFTEVTNNGDSLTYSPFGSEKIVIAAKLKVQCLLQKFTSCCIAQDLRMLHIKMLISSAEQETIQTNKTGEFAGHAQIKLPWIQEATVCSSVVEHITVCCSFSQLFEVEPKHCLVKNGDHLSIVDQSHNIPQSRYWILIGYVKQTNASRNQSFRFSVFLGAWESRVT